MPAPIPKDQVIVAQILTELAKIGSAGAPGPWLTNPPDATEGAPGDSIADVPHQLYVECSESPVDDDAVSVTQHARRLAVGIWLIARKPNSGLGWAAVRDLKADVERALYAAEPTFDGISLDWGLGNYTPRNDLGHAGFLAGLLECYFDYDSEHATP